MITSDRIALRIFDKLVGHGVSRLDAAQLGRGALLEMNRNSRLEELRVIQILDSWGRPHAVISRKPRPGAVELFRLDIRAMRLAERQAIVRAFAVQDTLTA